MMAQGSPSMLEMSQRNMCPGTKFHSDFPADGHTSLPYNAMHIPSPIEYTNLTNSPMHSPIPHGKQSRTETCTFLV